jgi:hypothetical protein
MSDTPETDYAYKNHPWDMHDNIPLEFARQLERERDRLAEAGQNLPDYDAGLIGDHGGGDVGWWQDYIRAEIGRANEYWREALAAVKGENK